MQEVFWFKPGRIAGRAGPHLIPWREETLRAGGIQSVLNLSEVAPATTALERVGLRAKWNPLPTDVPPTEETVRACAAALPTAWNFLSDEHAAGRCVLVHCTAGQDRTGMLLTLWLVVREGCSFDEAITRVRAVRPKAITAPGWEELARRVVPTVAKEVR